MSDQPGDAAHDQPAADDVATGPAGPDAAVPAGTEAAEPAVPEPGIPGEGGSAGEDPAGAGLAQPAPDTAYAPPAGPAVPTEPGWYPQPDGQLAYFDGAVWTGAVAPREGAKATFGEKFRRRWPIALLVVALVNAATAWWRAELAPIRIGGTDTTAEIFTIASIMLIGLLVGGAIWGLIAAAFPGKKLVPNPKRTPLLIIAIVVSVAVAGLIGWVNVKGSSTPAFSVSTKTEACKAYLDEFESAVERNITDARLASEMTSLRDAVQPVFPELADDIQPLTRPTVTQDDVLDVSDAVITRCVDGGFVTPEEVQAWAQRVQDKAPSGS
jgi:hypothetical protein